jgi:hypothetical protein
MDDHPIERFDPLLRNMLAWGLVEEAADGTWRLRPEVGERLGSLARLTHRPETAAVVYFGHFCGQCHASGPTWRLEGRYLCEACRRALAEGPAPAPESTDTGQRRLVSRHRAGGIAS